MIRLSEQKASFWPLVDHSQACPSCTAQCVTKALHQVSTGWPANLGMSLISFQLAAGRLRDNDSKKRLVQLFK
jgi:hypothetical protein